MHCEILTRNGLIFCVSGPSGFGFELIHFRLVIEFLVFLIHSSGLLPESNVLLVTVLPLLGL